MFRHRFQTALAITFLLVSPLSPLSPLSAWGDTTSTWVDVGQGHANAGASTDAPMGIARTQSRVGDVNIGRGLALGFGPDGLTLSHSIGVQDEGRGFGHNFNLSIGREGTNIGHSGVVTHGENSRSVIAGGTTQIDRRGPRGGTYAGGTGQATHAWSRNQVHRSRSPSERRVGPFQRRFHR